MKLAGKIIEVGDLECLQDEAEPSKSGVVVLIDREQLKRFPRSLFQKVEITFPDLEQK